jgi:hypothetical protein
VTNVLRAGAIVLLLTAAGLVIAVHLVARGFDPVNRRLSEYVAAEAGYLMTAAFFVLGIGIAVLGVAIGVSGARRSVTVAALLMLSGVAMVIAGLAPTDPDSTSAAEVIHSRASGGATLALIAAALLWSWSLDRGEAADMRAVATVAAVLGATSVLLHETAVSGLGQRALWLTLLVWMLLAAIRLPRGARRRHLPRASTS